ncbi:hypothetical protein BKA70DRAFT_382017 [Coprinopsis sp. MPI-PUGE-AT-0042]|nr:hypothetical protein BKA70DRAFT_382017 [Coprinopsis sp. MPI-PUGE-AT-0042]
MSSLQEYNPLFRNADDFDVLAEDVDVEIYVESEEFAYHCAQRAGGRLSGSSDNSDASDNSMWSRSSTVSSATTVESYPNNPSEYEAVNFFSGISSRSHGPRLVYRSSEDEFEEPSGPEAYKRKIRAIPVEDDHEIYKDWEPIVDETAEVLTRKEIIFSDIELARFTWLDENAPPEINWNDYNFTVPEGEELNFDDIPRIKPLEDGVRRYTNPTIWISVPPGHLTGQLAQEAAKDILSFLDSLGTKNIDIAFRESVAEDASGHGTALPPPAEDGDPLKEFIDNLSVALSIPIASMDTMKQSTLGPLFACGERLCAITTRHGLFLPEDNAPYKFRESAPKREVLLMGQPAYVKFLKSIQAALGVLQGSVIPFEARVDTYSRKVKDGINIEDSQAVLQESVAELAKVNRKIKLFKSFFVDVVKQWGQPEDRVIGFVSWAPPIGVGVRPHCYTRDFCVIELYKHKFKNMIGNVLSLGPELDSSTLNELIYTRDDIPTIFKYPKNGLLPLRRILTANQIRNPDSLTLEGERIRRVIKRGSGSNTTVGTFTRFMAFRRKYKNAGHVDSYEVAVFPHEDRKGPFSKGGDSGSIIVSPGGDYVALLTGGTNTIADSADITFATPFEWVWDLIKEEFPGANLNFQLPEFLADVA